MTYDTLYIHMKKILLYSFFTIAAFFLAWLILWGDFKEWHYSRNLHCDSFTTNREKEICKSIQENQNYELLGHGSFSAGYKFPFSGAKNAWCELHLTSDDFATLKAMKLNYGDSLSLEMGTDFLYSLLDAKLNPNSDLYTTSNIFSPLSKDYLLKDGCN